MSAYVVDPYHIAALVGAAIERRLTWLAPEEPREEEETHRPGEPWGKDALTAAARRRREATDATATEIARMLLLTNARSVAYRYDEPITGDLPGLVEGVEIVQITWTAAECRAAARASLADPVHILSALACFRYQSCERPDWEQSEAAAFYHALLHAAIGDLPGWDAAPWHLEAPVPA